MAKARKTPKPKQPSHDRIDREGDALNVYPILDELVRTKRPELKEARIALAWRYGLKKNKDGLLVLGKCRKVGDLDKQFSGFDFVIVLNREAWTTLDAEQKRALMFHELCHAAIAEDQNGNPKKDARGRQCFRLRKHDVEEFGEVIEHFGCYMLDLENFVATAMKSPKPPQPSLLDGIESDGEPASGGDAGGGTDGGKGEAAVEQAKDGQHVEQVKTERGQPAGAQEAAGQQADRTLTAAAGG